MVPPKNKVFNFKDDIQVGDLVRLKEDEDFAVGVGLVLSKQIGNGDIMGMIISRHDIEDPSFIEEIPEYLLFRPIYLVLWHGEHISPTNKPVWMFKTELAVIQKKKEE